MNSRIFDYVILWVIVIAFIVVSFAGMNWLFPMPPQYPVFDAVRYEQLQYENYKEIAEMVDAKRRAFDRVNKEREEAGLPLLEVTP